ncbi:phosphomevalonate kinase [Curtobacterium sp. PhB130]|uniref:phosphomevalonate kinase n=1 Tax=unclassified Curtobacterium TaxID=257496 RepID=UPI000F4B12A1|nr:MULTISPECIES: phosphomevalonate kinase [unclassified Curtobacterium]ROP61127.1 phosphomevalonate kinase [Curtobacterium sp. ZW137]ROS75762.1 phosphomevalonate kinase [Curtobacterium sp. PhB130]TCK64503.1 phosphomevalonate kinase [Curtobacterium sp. PhB136]
MIEFRAHGKLFVAGEYAVVEPGQPSVIIALDRAITARVAEGHGAGSVHSEEYGHLPLTWTRAEDGLALDREHHPYDYVMATIDLVEKLRAELGIEPRFHDLRISSQLDDASGRKFGLGSSAAVTVATVGALDRFYGLGLSQRQRFQVALLATIRVNPRASGGDLAASTFGGWLRYSAPDREHLAAQLDDRTVSDVLHDAAAWEGFDVQRLPAPEHLRLLVGWTGSPASTTKLVGVVRRHRNGGYATFLDDSRACVDDLTTGLQTGDTERTLDALRRARGLMQRLGDSVGSVIETERLTTLCDVVERAGGAAKPSGAGGGDCGIALVPAESDSAGILREWEAHDIRHLTIAVQPPEGPIE